MLWCEPFKFSADEAAARAAAASQVVVDANVMDTIIALEDRNTLEDLGIAEHIEQDRIIAEWLKR